MTASAVSTIFAVILVVALAGVGSVLVLDPRGLRAQLEQWAIPLAWLVAVGATLGSLWYSEVKDFVPCEFCWYQRIAMYPLAVVLARVPWFGDHRPARYLLPLPVIGAGLSIYHYQLQLFPEQSSSCSAFAPCTGKWVEVWGFVTIPLLALAAFVLIGLLLHIAGSDRRQGPTADVSSSPEAEPQPLSAP